MVIETFMFNLSESYLPISNAGWFRVSLLALSFFRRVYLHFKEIFKCLLGAEILNNQKAFQTHASLGTLREVLGSPAG